MHVNILHKNLVLIVVAILIMSNSGCKKFDNPNTTTGTQTIEDLIIPDNFSWNTNKTVNFSIKSDNAQLIKITSADGSIVFHKGFYNTLDESYDVQLNIPSRVTEVLVNNHPVQLNSFQITITLGDNNLKSVGYVKTSTLDKNIVASWNFNENSGNIVQDLKGSNSGTVSGADWVVGINGSALDFNGEGGNVIVPNSAALNLTNNQISHSLWFKRDNVQDDGAFIFQRMKYIVRIDKWGKISFSVYNPDWSAVSMDWNDRVIDTDWHHLVTTYDGSQLKIFLDTKLMASTETSGNLRSSNSDVFIGNQDDLNDFDGSIDEVAIYNKALSPEDINDLYTNTKNPGDGSQSLISKWSFNEGDGNSITDSIGGNNGSLHDASWSHGISGNCLSFDGIDDYAVVPNSENLNVKNAITIMAWAKTNENKTAKIIEKGDWDGHGLGLDVWKGWNGVVRLENNTSLGIDWNNGRPVLGEWYHLAVTYDGSSIKIYVNGQLKNSKEASGKLKINSRDVSFGSDMGEQKFFNGSIDEVMIFGKALSQTEIQGIFQKKESEDKDGDGIPDSEDDYPDDPGRAFNNFYPASSYGSLAFEDLWPSKGDYDFNDLVLDYRFTTITNSSNKISDIGASFVLRAIGAGFSNGFGFQLPVSNIPDGNINISGYNLQENLVSLNENGTEAGQDKITVIVFDNAKNLLQATSGFGVNVTPNAPYQEPDTIQININFNSNLYTFADIKIEDFNPFLIVNGDRGKEIHLPNMEPTNLANQAYFGTLQDNSNPGNNRYYKTINNLPWAINIPESYNYTIEKSQILSGYLKFGEWAESGGVTFPDWYQNKEGYRDNTHIYQVPQ